MVLLQRLRPSLTAAASSLPPSASRSAACIVCQWRNAFSTAPSRSTKPASTPSDKSSVQETASSEESGTAPAGPLANAPRGYGRRVEEFTPTPLVRPIGMPEPPQVGDNSGIDSRSMRERHADFVDYDKHIARRKQLKEKISKPYFRDWSNLSFHKGKTFFAPPRPFKAEFSLYFPNLQGRTLSKDDTSSHKDTTPVLVGKVSVIAVFSSAWAEGQAASFVSRPANPALNDILDRDPRTQLVQLNVEENWLKAWLVRRFFGSLRRKLGKASWDRYFLIRKGVTDEIRERIGLLNSKVGYTYVVDQNCRIRWAGSGQAEGEECDGLVKAVQRILGEIEKGPAEPAARAPKDEAPEPVRVRRPAQVPGFRV